MPQWARTAWASWRASPGEGGDVVATLARVALALVSLGLDERDAAQPLPLLGIGQGTQVLEEPKTARLAATLPGVGLLEIAHWDVAKVHRPSRVEIVSDGGVQLVVLDRQHLIGPLGDDLGDDLGGNRLSDSPWHRT